MRPHTLSARAKAVLVIAAGVLSATVVVGLALEFHSIYQKSVVAQTHSQLLTTARSVSLGIRELHSVLSDSLVSVSGNAAVQHSLKSGITGSFPFGEMNALREAHRKHAEALYVLDAAGRVVLRSPAPSPGAANPASLADSQDVTFALRSRVAHTSRPFRNAAGNLMISSSAPIYAGGEFVGVALWLIDVKTLVDHFVTPVRVGRSGYAQLIDSEGMLLGLPDATQIGRSLLEKPKRLFPGHDWSDLESLLQSTRDDGEGKGTAAMVCWLDDEHRDQITAKLLAFAPVKIGGNSWSVIMSIDREEVWLPIRKHARSQVFMLALLLAVAALAGQRWLSAQRLSALEAGERKYRGLFESMQDGFALHEIILDAGGAPVDYRFLEVNPAFESLTGLRAGDIVGRTVLEVLPETEPYWIEMYGRVALTGEPAFFQNRSATLGRHYEGKVYRPAPDQFAVVFGDATERIRAEEALQAGERRFRTLFESMAEGVALHEVVHDAAGAAVDYRILEINPAYERHTGLHAADARGALASRLYGTGTPPHLEEYAAVAHGGPPHVFETYFPPLRRHFFISVVSPQQGHFATVFEDVTDRKLREEELRQKNAELERFIYTISHDLKSPLVTVKTFLGYLEQDLARDDAAKIAQDIAYMSAAAAKMGTLLDELLELSRVGRSVNPPSRTTFNDLVEEARSMVAGRIAARGISVWAYEADVTLLGDRARLVEIWQNLIDNAVKYMGDQGAPRIEIGVETRAGERVFFVRDNGIGIEPRFHEKIFGLFEKLDPKSAGTGLGLALVQRIVEFYRGTIRVESAGAGKGSSFFFTLPAAIAPDKNEEKTDT